MREREERNGWEKREKRSGQEKFENQRRHERLRSRNSHGFWRGREKAWGQRRESRRSSGGSKRHSRSRCGVQRRRCSRTSAILSDSPKRRRQSRSRRRGESLRSFFPGKRANHLRRWFPLRDKGRDRLGPQAEIDVESDGEGGTNAVFIDNISREADERAVRWLLRMDGDIVGVFISRKRRQNNNLAFAIVRMVNGKSVTHAVERVHGRTFMGHRIFARRAKYVVKSEIGAAGRLANRTVDKIKGAPLSGGPESTHKEPECGGNGRSSGGNDGGADLEVPVDVEVMVGGACVKDGGVRLEKAKNSNSQTHLRIVVSCCCRSRDSAHEESSMKKAAAASPSISNDKPAIVGNGNIDEGKEWAGNFVNGVQYVPWSGAPCAGWVYPSVGYWPSYMMQGCDPYGWWGQMQGWDGAYRWPYDYGLEQMSPGHGQPNPPPPVQSKPDLEAVGSGVRVPNSIREPLIGRRQDPDPVMEDIVRSVRGYAEEEVLGFDKMGSGAKLGNGLGHIGENSPIPDHGDTQARLVEEDPEGFGLSNLFEDPEFPPGFEPVGNPPRPEVVPEEMFVKEEARQTLKLAKQLGCSVTDEDLALSNLEGIIREQRASYRQRCQAISEGSKEESDGCSRNTSKDKPRKVPGLSSVGFSKLSRVSRVAMRGKKKTK